MNTKGKKCKGCQIHELGGTCPVSAHTCVKGDKVKEFIKIMPDLVKGMSIYIHPSVIPCKGGKDCKCFDAPKLITKRK